MVVGGWCVQVWVVILAVAVFNTFVNYILEEHTVRECLRNPEVVTLPLA